MLCGCASTSTAAGESGDSRSRVTAGNRRQFSEYEPKRMDTVEFVVPVARQEESGHRLDPARHQPQNVERRLVCPVDVLEDNNVGLGERTMRRRTAATSCGFARCARASSSAPPVRSAISRSGPKGRGVNRGSHAPQSARAS